MNSDASWTEAADMITTFASWVEPVAILVGWASVSAAVLIVGIWLLRKALGTTLGPGWRSILGWLVVARLIWLVAPESQWSWRNWVDLPTAIDRPGAGQATVAEGTGAPLETPVGSTEWMAPSLIETGVVFDVAEAVSSEEVSAAEVSDTEVARGTLAERIPGWAALVWGAGAVSMLGIAVANHCLFWLRVRRFSAPLPAPCQMDAWLDESRQLLPVRRRVLLRTIEGLASPVVFGYFRPVILLPAEVAGRLTAVEARHIFLHELAHIRCGDVLANWLLIFVRSLHWFNPLVWASLRRIVADRELLRDAMALRALPGGDAARREYGHTLLRLATTLSRPRLSPGLASLIHTEKEIQRRIAMIKTPIANTHGPWPHALAGAFALALAAVTFTAAARGQAADAEATNTLKPPSPAESPAAIGLSAGRDELNPDLLADAGPPAEPPATELPTAKSSAGNGSGDLPPKSEALGINQKRLANLDAEIARMTAEGKKQEVDILTSLRGDLLKEIYRAKYLSDSQRTATAMNNYRALSAARAADKESTYARANDPNVPTERTAKYNEIRRTYEQPAEVRELRQQLEAKARQVEDLQRQLAANEDSRKLLSALSSDGHARYDSYLSDLTKLKQMGQMGLGPAHPDMKALKAAIENHRNQLDESAKLIRALEKKLKIAPADDRPTDVAPDTVAPPRSADEAPAPELPPRGAGASDDSSQFGSRGRESWPKSLRTKPAPEVRLPLEGDAAGDEPKAKPDPKREAEPDKAKSATESAPKLETKPEPKPTPEAGTRPAGSRE